MLSDYGLRPNPTYDAEQATALASEAGLAGFFYLAPPAAPFTDAFPPFAESRFAIAAKPGIVSIIQI